MTADSKPTNPKDGIGSLKIDLSVIPASSLAALAAAHAEGARKYGRFNWLIAGVRSSIYIAALFRHVLKWTLGERVDPKTKIHHLGNAMACLSILIDSEVAGAMVDDRPPTNPGALAFMAEMEAAVNGLPVPESPPQNYTIKDTKS